MFLLLLLISIVQGKTVRYSNVPPRSAITTKTYDLEVPGSAPIRIIEAEPIWTTEIPNTTPFYRDDFEHRSSKPKTARHYFTTQSTKTTISEPVTHEPEHATVYSPEALNKFLKDYNQRIKADRKKFSLDEEVHTEQPITEEPINKLASIYLDNEEKANEEDKQKSWGLVDMQHHNHPYEDKKGWVSLDAVPWSTSKISKWQSKHKNEPKPWENNNRPPQSNWNTKPYKSPSFDTEPTSNYNGNTNNYNGNSNNYNGNSNNYNNQHSPYTNYNNPNINDKNYFDGSNNEDQYNSNEGLFFEKPVASYDQDIRPSNDFPSHEYPSRPNFPERPERPERPHGPYLRPTYGYDTKPMKIKPALSNNWSEDPPSRPNFVIRPSSSQNQWTSNNNNNNNKPLADSWDRNQSPQFMYVPPFTADDNRDIITDGRPGDFPQPMPSSTPHLPNYEPIHTPERPTIDHPPSHPLNGNGEWVLVSTTKGYQYPRTKRHRSIEVTPDSIGTRRGIRLTVLPPDEDANVNMTTSHGGLLEVESTFETVEESQNKYTEIQLQHNDNRTGLPHKIPHVLLSSPPVVTARPIKSSRPVTVNKRRPTAVKPVVIHNKQDATALMAAVGAGMIPATMAMLVPFVTGRRRRSVETTLQRTANATKVPVLVYRKSKFS